MLFSPSPFRRSALSRLILATGVLSLALLPGCGGCGGGDDADADADGTQAAADKDKDKTKAEKDKDKKDKDKAKKEKPKPPPDFDSPRMAILPNDASGNLSQSGLQGIKPGHWGSAVLEMKANNFDFSGELDSWLMNSRGDPLGLQGLPYQLASRRPAILPKGQKKYFEVSFFVPPLEEQKSPRLYTKLTTRGGGEVLSAPADPLVAMPAHQYYFIVLAREPLKYSVLKQLNSIAPKSSEFVGLGNDAHYRVSIPTVDKRMPLPSHLLAWTSIAYVLWDDANQDVLSEEQKNALIDWLHWGGQLIVSGPDTIAALQKPGGFLEPYLPATAGDSIKIDQQALTDLNRYWSIPERDADKTHTRELRAVEPFAGVKLTPRPGAAEVPHTGELFYERRVGRGRIVVSAFRLSQRELRNWWSFDSFFNACLLGRPSRRFGEGRDGSDQIAWTDTKAPQFDPAINTKVRFMGRDTGADFSKTDLATNTNSGQQGPYWRNAVQTDFSNDQGVDSENTPATPGLGGWSDFNDVSNTARDSLRAAAGIEIPQASFVVWSLAAYLIVLVPVNWAFFRLIGRVEWAWIAAPILAIAGTVFVTKMAHLDIGFTRSEREVALVELHAGHSRAHVTRYTALYTSLSSSYQFAFDDPSAEVLPFSTDKSYQMLIGQGRSNIEFRQEDKVSLNGFDISSNSTGMIHSEHVADLGGGVRLTVTPGGELQIQNGTKLNLASAGVIRKRHDGQLELGWIGELPAGAAQSVEKFKPRRSAVETSEEVTTNDGTTTRVNKTTFQAEPFFPDTSGTGDAARDEQWTKGRVLRDLFRLLQDEKQFKNGDSRLFAWTADEIPGAHTDPAAPQVRRASLVVAHLEYARLPAPRRDANLAPLKDAAPEPVSDVPLEPQPKTTLNGLKNVFKNAISPDQ